MNGTAASPSLAVVIPTRSRPRLLRRCLDSLAASQQRLGFSAYVCDSSPQEADREGVRNVCADYPWARLCPHEGANVAAARNTGARAAQAELLVDVDDDLILEPEAIDRLLRRYVEGSGRRVVAGSVSINGTWSTPVKKRRIGYGRPVLEGEEPDFVIGALFLYPRSFALVWPWNERIDTADDIFMGALWRSHGVRILFAPDARAAHPDVPLSFDPDRLAETVEHQSWHVYSLLFDALIANPSIGRALSYEVLGFAASAKVYLRRRALALPFLRSWARGHRRLIADRAYLKGLVGKELQADA